MTVIEAGAIAAGRTGQCQSRGSDNYKCHHRPPLVFMGFGPSWHIGIGKRRIGEFFFGVGKFAFCRAGEKSRVIRARDRNGLISGAEIERLTNLGVGNAAGNRWHWLGIVSRSEDISKEYAIKNYIMNIRLCYMRYISLPASNFTAWFRVDIQLCIARLSTVSANCYDCSRSRNVTFKLFNFRDFQEST